MSDTDRAAAETLISRFEKSTATTPPRRQKRYTALLGLSRGRATFRSGLDWDAILMDLGALPEAGILLCEATSLDDVPAHELRAARREAGAMGLLLDFDHSGMWVYLDFGIPA